LSKDRESTEIAKKWIEKIYISLKDNENFVLEKKDLKEIIELAERVKKNSTHSLRKIIEKVETKIISRDKITFFEFLNTFLSKDFSKEMEREK